MKFRSLKEGDTVTLRTPNLETKQKNTPVASGPFTIHKVVGRNTYKLKDANGKKLKYVVNGRRLALFAPCPIVPKPKPAKKVPEYIKVYTPTLMMIIVKNILRILLILLILLNLLILRQRFSLRLLPLHAKVLPNIQVVVE